MEQIYTWSCEGDKSTRYYDTKDEAIKSVIRKYKSPECFGVSQYVNTSNDTLLEYIFEQLEYANTEECKDKAFRGVRKAEDVLEFKRLLVELVREYK